MSNNASVPMKLFSFDLPRSPVENPEPKPAQTFGLASNLKHKLARNATHSSIAAPKRARDKEETSEDLLIDTNPKKSPAKTDLKPSNSKCKVSKPRPQSAYITLDKSESQLYQEILNRKVEANTIQPVQTRDYGKGVTNVKPPENLKDILFRTEVVVPSSSSSTNRRPGSSQAINRSKSGLNSSANLIQQVIKPLNLLEPKSLSSSIL
jgi:hypothetical protein